MSDFWQHAASGAMEIAFALALAVLTGLAARLYRWLGIREDDAVRAYLDQALGRAVAYGLAQARGASGLPPLSADPVVAAAVRYAQDRVPDALRRFGIDEPGLAEMVRARLPQRLGGPLGA